MEKQKIRFGIMMLFNLMLLVGTSLFVSICCRNYDASCFSEVGEIFDLVKEVF